MTLLELLIVITTISIIGSVAATKMSSPASLTIGHQAKNFISHIRHAQSLAQDWGCQLKIVVSTTGYEVRNKIAIASKPECSLADTIIQDPTTAKNFSETFSNGVQISAGSTFDFDIKGIPRDTTTNAILAGAVSYDVVGGGNTITVSISNITGFVSSTGP